MEDTKYLSLTLIQLFLIVLYFFNKKTKKTRIKIIDNVFIYSYTLCFLILNYFNLKFEDFVYGFLLVYVISDYFYHKKEERVFDKTSILIIFIIYFFKTFIIGMYETPTGSMLPTIKTNKVSAYNLVEYGIQNPFSNKLLYQWNEPKRQDIVVFKYTDKNGKVIPYLKRVIGIEGDTVIYNMLTKELIVKNASGDLISEYELVEQDQEKITYLEKNKEGKHYIYIHKDPINKIDEQHIQVQNMKIPNIIEVKVEKGEMFVMGDNRDRSLDSRFLGKFKTNTLIGKKMFIEEIK